MPSESPLSADLLDLKLLPAWVKETETKSYDHYTGEEGVMEGRRGKRPTSNRVGRGDAAQRPPSKADRPSHARRPTTGKGGRDSGKFGDRRGGEGRPPRHGKQDRHREDRQEAPRPIALDIGVRFLPRSPVLESVVAQIKSGSVSYSLFHLARLFLEKPERYEVRLTAKPEVPVFQLGENGAVGSDRQVLERDAFRLAQEEFYKVDITQGEPIKGNFTSVARDRLSGMLLGPTNYHSYQPRLRTLYEQRFSRRMSFPDYQRQIEIVNDPALVERWKEETQRITTYTTLREETPATFSSATEVERHFRATYLPDLVRTVTELTIGGVPSRRLADRAMHLAIEDAWASEFRSPSNMMQELAGEFREAGLHIFRHRRGMLFVSPVRVRAFVHDQAGVSPTVNAILEVVTATPRIGRKEMADKLIGDSAAEDAESRKLALASDLHWLIREGYVIEFNDGSLDLPRGKTKPQENAVVTESAAEKTPAPDGQPEEPAQPALSPEAEIGGG